MKKSFTEFTVGLFVFAGIICMAYISINLGQINLFNNEQYPIKASFTSVSGLKEDTTVEMSGVTVGHVEDIRLENYQAIVTMLIHNDIQIPEDTIASIRTQGLLGAKFVEITPGGSSVMLEPGEMIFDTEPPFEFMTAIKGMVVEK